MREKFHEGLDELTDRLTSMCRLATQAVELATDALVGTDLVKAEAVFAVNEQIEAHREPSETLAMTLLALQAPVASDLRRIVTAIHLIADLTRMGALAQHVATGVRRRHPDPVAPPSAAAIVERMGALAVELGRAAEQVLVSKDPAAAAAIDTRDDEMDELQRQLFALVGAPEWDGGVCVAVDITLIGRYYERFGDHAVEVGRRIVFLTTGALTSA